MKQTVVERHNHEIPYSLDKDLNDCEVLIVFKLTELPCSC